jgi:hypothetical protein
MAGSLLSFAFLFLYRTAKRLEMAGQFSQYSLSLLCFAFLTVLLFGDLLCLYETLDQFSLHSGRDGNALVRVCNWASSED